MAIELGISGYLEMHILNMDGTEVSESVEKEVLENLDNVDYLISIKNRTISSLDNIGEALYKFEVEPTLSVSYEFDEF